MNASFLLRVCAFLQLARVASGCGGCGSAECEGFDGGLWVYCVNAKNQSMQICNATVVALSGDYRETLTVGEFSNGNCVYQGVGNRAGTYDVVVTAPDYASHTTSGVALTPTSCGTGATITIALDALPSEAGADTNDSGPEDGDASEMLDASDESDGAERLEASDE